jgi:rod shape-determining protein MreD
VVLVFWSVHQPRRVGMGLAFLFGLLMDVHQAALLGQHALAYTLLGFAGISIHRRLLWFGVVEQALQMLPLFVAVHLVCWNCAWPRAVCFRAGALLPPLFRPCCGRWPAVLLLAPQRRAPDPDE